MSNNKPNDFSKFYKNKMEERLVNYLEIASGLYSDNLKENIQAQSALVSRAIENIALMLAENGYVNPRGHFVRFQPTDLLTINSALTMALRLRADVMMLPLGLEGLTKAMASVDKLTTPPLGANNPNVGLNEPPPMVAVDAKETVVEEPTASPIQEEAETFALVKLPVKTKS